MKYEGTQIPLSHSSYTMSIIDKFFLHPYPYTLTPNIVTATPAKNAHTMKQLIFYNSYTVNPLMYYVLQLECIISPKSQIEATDVVKCPFT